MNRLDPAGKVVVVTGGAQGIGRAVAARMVRLGARVALVDRDAVGVHAAAKDLGPNAVAYAADVRDRECMRRVMRSVTKHFGSIDVIVANAGVSPTPATVRALDDDEFDRVIGVNITGVYNTVRPALDQIVAGRGHVVIVSSGASFAPGAGGSPYMVSKAAVSQLGRALRLELAVHGASAGVVYFGIVDTDMTHDMLDSDELGRQIGGLLPWPLNRRISADDAARVIVGNVVHRHGESFAPAGWRALKWVHGAANPLLDRYLVRSATMHRLLAEVDRGADKPGHHTW